jgi:hypothetical protein
VGGQHQQARLLLGQSENPAGAVRELPPVAHTGNPALLEDLTTSTPRSFHGSCAGSRNCSTLNSSPSTAIVSSFASTLECRLPRTESYFSRWASVLALVRSLTATKSMSRLPIAARMMLRPIRPKPLIPTLTAIDLSYAGRTLRSTSAPIGETLDSNDVR